MIDYSYVECSASAMQASKPASKVVLGSFLLAVEKTPWSFLVSLPMPGILFFNASLVGLDAFH